MELKSFIFFYSLFNMQNTDNEYKLILFFLSTFCPFPILITTIKITIQSLATTVNCHPCLLVPSYSIMCCWPAMTHTETVMGSPAQHFADRWQRSPANHQCPEDEHPASLQLQYHFCILRSSSCFNHFFLVDRDASCT